MIFAILRDHQKFEKLANFNLENALIETERLRLLKESRLVQQHRHSIDEQIPDPTSPGGLSEKARGKLPEASSLSRVSSTSSIHSSGAPLPQRQSSVSSISSTGSLLPGAKNGFIPTEDWVTLVKLEISKLLFF